MRAAGLWCFPLAAQPKTYVYLPSSARLATDDAGRPQFSFVRYVAEAKPARPRETSTSINTSGGGGILHFLVLIDTPEASVAEAQKVLRQTLKDDDVTLRGPVVFADGRYALVSSVLVKPDAPPERKMLATGRAPVLEGNRLAFSFDLSPEQATLLHKSMQMRTPDISIVFDMTFTGLNEAYDADLTINWSEVRNSQSFGAGGSVYFIGGDVELAFDELRRNNAIKLRSSGSDATMEALLTTVYSKLLELLFKPVEPERVPEGQRGGLMNALNTMLDNRGALGSRRTTGFGLNVSYQLKDMRSSGITTLNFNHRATVERHSFITFNIGDLYTKHGKDTAFFRDVSLEDPTFRQREVQIGVDGALLPEFERYINGVTLTLRKQHQNGEETLREIVLDRRAVQADAGEHRLEGRLHLERRRGPRRVAAIRLSHAVELQGRRLASDRLDARGCADDRSLHPLRTARRADRRRSRGAQAARRARGGRRGELPVLRRAAHADRGRAARPGGERGAAHRDHAAARAAGIRLRHHLAARRQSPADGERHGLGRHRLHRRSARFVGSGLGGGGHTHMRGRLKRIAGWSLAAAAARHTLRRPTPWCWTTRTR